MIITANWLMETQNGYNLDNFTDTELKIGMVVAEPCANT